MKTLQNHFVRSTLFLLFALLCPILVQAQGTPRLSNEDFTMTLIDGNSTCGKPGAVQVRYRNAVAGWQTLRYSIYTNGGRLYTQDVAPNAVFMQTLEELEDGDRFTVDVRGITTGGVEAGGTTIPSNSEREDRWQHTYSLKSIEAADIAIDSEGVGGCSGTRGSLSMSMKMAGFSKVEWKVYQGTTLLKTITSTTPESPETIDQLAAGTYRIEARATPACTTTHPTPTTPGASWDGDVLVFTREVKVDAFNLRAQYNSGTIGTCNGNLSWQASRTSNISSIKAEILPRGGSVPLKTMTTSPAEEFHIYFNDVPAGDYTLRLTANCGSVVTRDFSVKTGTPNVWANYNNNDMYNFVCGKGYVQCNTNSTDTKQTITFRLFKESDNSLVATKTWQWSEGNNECRFTDELIDQEKYFVEADFCGVTVKSPTFPVYKTQLNLTWENISQAKGICTGQGGRVRIKVNTPQNVPVNQAGTLEIIAPDGSVFLTQSMPIGWSGEVILNDVPAQNYSLPPNNASYTARFTLDCNGVKGQTSGYMFLDSGKWFGVQTLIRQWLDQCAYRYELQFYPDGTAGNESQIIMDGDFEVRNLDDGTVVWQGKYDPSNQYMRIPLPGEGKYALIGSNSCGSYKIGAVFEARKQDLWGENPNYPRQLQITHLPLPCYDVGQVNIRDLDPYAYSDDRTNNGIADGEVLWDLEKDGLPYRTGVIKHGNYAHNYYNDAWNISDLPPGKYKVTVYLACDHTIKIERTFELKTELMPKSFSSTGSCGTKILGTTNISFYPFHTQQMRASKKQQGLPYRSLVYNYKLYNTDSGVFVQEGSMTSYGELRLENLKLPNGNYRLEITSPTQICGGLAPYNYNFTVPTLADDILVLSSQKDKSDLKIEHTPYLTSKGSLTVGLYKRNTYSQHTFVDDNFPIIFRLRAKNGSLTKTLTAYGPERNVKFEDLPAGLYEISATIDGSTCVPAREVKIETISDEKWSASAHLSPVCESGKQRKRHVSFHVTGSEPSLSTVVYTFKVYVWDDVASDYLLKKSLIGTPGQLTAMLDIADYAGTSAPVAPNSTCLGSNAPKVAYKYTIEHNGNEIYSTYDITDTYGYYYNSNEIVKADKRDATFMTGKGTITAWVNSKSAFNRPCGSVEEKYPLRLSLLDKIEWTLYPNGGGNPLRTETTDSFDPVTFAQLAPGNYSLQGRLLKKGCSQNYGGYGSFSHNFEILSPGVHLQATGTDGKCDSDCKITVKVLDDAAAFSKITYTITYLQDDEEKTKVHSTTDATQEHTFDGLPAGLYKVEAEAEVMTADGLRTFKAKSEVTLKTESPDMNIIQHNQATRPSFKNCATGYLAFKFQDDRDSYSIDYARRFNDDYEFTITAAPAGVSVPLTFKVEHAHVFYYNTITAITPFRNLPAGEYKVKVTNHCKTLFLTCQIGEIEDLNIPNPWGCVNFWRCCSYSYDYDDNDAYLEDYLSPSWGYGPLSIRRHKGKYWFQKTPLSNVYGFFDDYRTYGNIAWEDLITQDIHDSFGNEMTNIPLGWGAKELTVRPWFIDKVTFKFNCAAVPDKTFTGNFTTCGGDTRTYCGNPTVNVSDFIRRARLPETLTLVVNELNGGVKGAEVLRKTNLNVTYSLGTVPKSYLVQLYTADNFLLAQYPLIPVPVGNTMTLTSRSMYNCQTTAIDIQFSNDVVDCYSPYILKTYKGSGATRTLLREEIFNDVYSNCRNRERNDYEPDTDYDFELYTANGTLLDHKGIRTPQLDATVTLPTTFYFGNVCNTSFTNTVVETYQHNGKEYRKMYYRLKYFYSDTWDNNKHYYNQNYYNGCNYSYSRFLEAPLTLTVIKDGVTYKGDIEGLGSPTMIQQWWIERNGKWYQSLGPVFAWDEPINGTLTGVACGLSVNITGTAVKKENNYNYHTTLDNMTMVQTCTGWNITPGGKVVYTAADGTKQTFNYKEYRDPYTGQWKKVDVPFAQPKSPNEFCIDLRGDDLCDGRVCENHLVYKPHALNQIESASYYCTDDNKGHIYVGAQDGVPPYRYELLNGDDENDPVIQTKTDNGPVVFEYGDVGKRYRVHVFDACGSLRIHYFTTVLSTVDLGYELSKTRQFCAGDNLRLTMQSFPGATYDWTLPDGTHRNTRNLDLGPATRAMAGAYNVVITPSDCNSTINATITVVVDDIGAPSWTPAMQTICQGTTTTLSPGAAQSYTDNTPGTPKYQWQRRDPYGSSFSDIDGATMADYNFQTDTPGTYTFRRVTTYKGCEHTSDEAQVVVTPGPIQTLSPAELDRTVRKGSTGYTLTGGSLQTNGTSIASYKWERSTDGSTWTTVGTTANYKETQKFKLEKVYYRRTVTPTVGTCAHTTPVITVTFKKMRTAYVNPHIRTRVKSE